MNQFGADFTKSFTWDDRFRNIPTDVTACDRDKAELAAERPWPGGQ
jgi:hypothetical protein